MDKEIFKLLTMFVLFGLCFSIPVMIFWFDHRTRTKALDVLRVYAERGEEPPASVLESVTKVSRWGDYTPRPLPGERRPTTRGRHLAHAAGNVVLAAGLSWLAWWLFSLSGKTSAGIIVAILAALFFAAGLAARLVGAYYASSDCPRNVG